MSKLYACACCCKRTKLSGSGVRMVFGTRSRVCAKCKDRIDKTGTYFKEPKLPPVLIGADGKLRTQPNKAQKNFTRGGLVQPTKVAGYPGHDIRFTPAPGFKGEFCSLRPGQYAHEAQSCAAKVLP